MTLEQILKLAKEYNATRIKLHPDGAVASVELAVELQPVDLSDLEPPQDPEDPEYNDALQRMASGGKRASN